MPTPNVILGNFGEDLIARYISSQGLQVQHRGWRNKHKEIDIIALGPDGKMHFVEVKTRTNSQNELSGEMAFTKKKLQNIMMAAQSYMEQHNIETEMTIDLAVVNCHGNDSEIKLYPDIWQSFSCDCYIN